MTVAVLDMDFIAPPKKVLVEFALAPAYNVLSSLCLLNEDLSGLGDWVYQTAQALSPGELETNQRVCGAATEYVTPGDWPDFPIWLDSLSRRDPVELRDRTLAWMLAKARQILGADEELPSGEELLADRELYLSTIERVVTCKGHEFNVSHHEIDHRKLNDPPAWQAMIVSHLEMMWDRHVAPEWERNLATLNECVAAFEALDFSGLPASEIISRVTGREELPDGWEDWVAEIERIVFIPSMHIGPYLLLIDQDGFPPHLVFGARVPQGARVGSSALSRTELLMRLSALADDTRLQILDLLIQERELSAKEIMARLGLSQSSASRHLRQLTATGFLAERRHEIGKIYSLNRERIDGTLEAIRGSLH